MRELVVDVMVAQYAIGAMVIVIIVAFGGVFGVFHSLKERREQNRRMKEIMAGGDDE